MQCTKKNPIPSPTQKKSVEITISPSTAGVVSGGTVPVSGNSEEGFESCGPVEFVAGEHVAKWGVYRSATHRGENMSIPATSVADHTKSASASISVIPGVSLHVLFPPMRRRNRVEFERSPCRCSDRCASPHWHRQPSVGSQQEHHAQILEIFWQDCLLALDPAYPGNDLYGAAYAQVLTAATNAAIN